MRKLTEGKPIKVILLFMLPLLVGQIFQLFYNIVDTRIVGQVLGERSLAAVGATTSFSDLLIQFVFGITNGFALITASYFGAKDAKNLRKSVASTIILGGISAIILSTVCLVFIGNILSFLKVEDNLIVEAKSYICIILAGLIAAAFYNILAATLRAVGDSVTPLIFLIISAVLNVVLDYILIVYGHLGVAGAAYATVASQVVSVILCLVYIKAKYTELIPKREDWVLVKSILQKMIPTGLSMGFMSSLFNFGTVCLQTQINSLGADIIVAHTAARKLFLLLAVPFFTMSMTQASFSAQNMGAGRMDRIKEGVRDSILVCAGWSLFCFVFIELFTAGIIKQIIGMDEPLIIATSVKYLEFARWFFIVCASISIFRNAMQGFGDSVTPIISSSLELIVKVLIAYFLVPKVGYDGVIVCEPIAWCIMVIPLIINFFRSPLFRKTETINSK